MELRDGGWWSILSNDEAMWHGAPERVRRGWNNAEEVCKGWRLTVLTVPCLHFVPPPDKGQRTKIRIGLI